jgi:hypothetical protein
MTRAALLFYLLTAWQSAAPATPAFEKALSSVDGTARREHVPSQRENPVLHEATTNVKAES